MVAPGDDLPHRSALSIACPSRLLADIPHCRSSLRGFSFQAVENLPGPLNHRCLDSSRTSCWRFSHCLRHLPLLGVPNSIQLPLRPLSFCPHRSRLFVQQFVVPEVFAEFFLRIAAVACTRVGLVAGSSRSQPTTPQLPSSHNPSPA